MSQTRLKRRLEVVTRRIRRIRGATGSFVAFGLLAFFLGAMAVEGESRFELFKVACLGFPVAVAVGILFGRPRESDVIQAALLIEKAHPELDSRLLAAVQQQQTDGERIGFLQSELLDDVNRHAYMHPWQKSVTGLIPLRLFQFAAIAACCAIVYFASPKPTNDGNSDLQAAVNSKPPTGSEIKIVVEPGDTEVERGTSLLVLARFPDALPDEVELVATNLNQEEVRIPLRKSLDDPIYGGRIPDIEQDLNYHVVFDGKQTEDYIVKTFTYPELLKADAEIDFPEFTGLESKTIEDVRRVSVVEGSNLNFEFELNKNVSAASLVDAEGNRIDLQETARDQQRLLTWKAETPEKHRFWLELEDQDGRENRDRPEFVIQVLPNHPANLKVTFPARDMRVSPIEELTLQADASDDYGLLKYGLIYERPDGVSESLVLGEKADRDEKKPMDHLVRIEEMDVEPDQLISYYFFADDIGPDGEARRSYSDIFFSEVRPFEEIFREAPAQSGQQQQQQQQQQQGTQSGKLVEVQRQIVAAAWNLMRSEIRSNPSKNFEPSMQTLFESQEQAIEMASELRERMEDQQMLEHLEKAVEEMTSASRHFADGITNQKLESIPSGRRSAQSAYQELLKLNSREKQVRQSQQSQSSSSQSSQQRMNRQMNSLELKNDRDRYETERQAQQQQQQQEQRETLQVLNRLRELARRQEDLNQKLRELENQLRNTEDEEEKAELERQLKRLQEEQREMLRNLDELRERMNQEENRQRMAEAREQVDQTRERVLRASEALQENQTSEALTEGTRAQRELEELKEDFKRQSAGQFDDAVRELRQDVRELADAQSEIQQQMEGKEKSPEEGQRPTLRDSDDKEDRQEVVEALEDQRKRLSDVLDRTKELVQESENTEPLLADKLYETMRDLRKYEPEEALRGAAQLQRYGLDEEAQRAEQQARQGIERFQRGVEDAAKSVLGDEQEALAAASTELDALTQAIENELRTNSGEEESSDSARNSETGERAPMPMPPGQGQQQENQQASDQQSQQQPGQGQRQEQDSEQQSGQQPSQQNGEQQNRSGQQQQGQPQDGQQPGQREGQQKQEQQGRQGQQAGQQPSQQSQQQGQQSQSGQGQQQGQQQQNQGQQSDQQNQQQQGQQQPNGGQRDGGGRRQQQNLANRIGQLFQETTGGDNGGARYDPNRPLTGDDYVEWSDRMRDLEEMVTTPELRARVAQIRDEARKVRVDVKRHSIQPNWELVRTKIYGPLLELQELVAEEIARNDPNKRLVPIDRDPVPDKFSPLVQDYYEQLSRLRRDGSTPETLNAQ